MWKALRWGRGRAPKGRSHWVALLPADGEAPGRWVRQRTDVGEEGSKKERDRERGTERDRGHWPRDWSQCRVVALSPPTSPQNCVRAQITESNCHPGSPQPQGHSELCRTPAQNTQGNPRDRLESWETPGHTPLFSTKRAQSLLGIRGICPEMGRDRSRGPARKEDKWKVRHDMAICPPSTWEVETGTSVTLTPA